MPTISHPYLSRHCRAFSRRLTGRALALSLRAMAWGTGSEVGARAESLDPRHRGHVSASAVGQVLAQLGHDKAMRTRIVGSIPNLREIGTGSEKRLIF